MTYPDPGYAGAASDSLGAAWLLHLHLCCCCAQRLCRLFLQSTLVLPCHHAYYEHAGRFQLTVTVVAEVAEFERVGFESLVIVCSIDQWSANVSSYE